MTKESQKAATRYGRKTYAENPSVPDPASISRPKRVQLGDERTGIIIDNGTGEVLGHGGAFVYQFEEVDKERFVKLYLAGFKQAAGLSKAGLVIFSLVYDQLRDNKGRDYVLLSHATSGQSQATYSRGLRELISRGFLFDSPTPSMYWVNVQYMFNGDRLSFVKSYRLKKGDPRQQNLPLLPDGEQGSTEGADNAE